MTRHQEWIDADPARKPRIGVNWSIIPVSLQCWCVWEALPGAASAEDLIGGPFPCVGHAVQTESVVERASEEHFTTTFLSKGEQRQYRHSIYSATDTLFGTEEKLADRFDEQESKWLVVLPSPGDGNRWVDDHNVFFDEDVARIESLARLEAGGRHTKDELI